MSIPKFHRNGELPVGEYQASLNEIEARFGRSSEGRKQLMLGLRSACRNFELANVRKLWIDGSFITNKVDPNDIDGCWEYTRIVDMNVLDPVFLDSKEAMRNKYGLDFFISNIIEGGSGLPFPGFFQMNRDGNAKGIIVVILGGRDDYKQ